MSVFLRSLLFNLVYFTTTLILGIALLWTLLLPRKTAFAIYKLYFRYVTWLERWILGLRYSIEGTEHLPKDGKYIIAAKHQSAMETLLFPVFLDDPAVILKKELTRIPLWGWYAKKAGMISVDRGGFSTALKSMNEGAKRVFAEGRPIIIFPQGTRTALHHTPEDKPYKSGIVKIFKELNCPIVPMAVNTGFFWGRNAFFKKPGIARLKFLPALDPATTDPKDLLSILSDILEPESETLVAQARTEHAMRKTARLFENTASCFVFAVLIWAMIWMLSAQSIRTFIYDFEADVNAQNSAFMQIGKYKTSGFPHRITLSLEDVVMTKSYGPSFTAPLIKARSWPFPHARLTMTAPEPIMMRLPAPSRLDDSVTMEISQLDIAFRGVTHWMWKKTLTYKLKHFAVTIDDEFSIEAHGTITEDQDGVLNGEIIVTLKNYENFLKRLIAIGLVDGKRSKIVLGVMKVQDLDKEDDGLSFAIRLLNNDIYVGLARVATIRRVEKETASE